MKISNFRFGDRIYRMIYITEGISRKELVKFLFSLENGKFIKSDYIHYHDINSFIIESDDMDVMIDNVHYKGDNFMMKFSDKHMNVVT